MEEESVIRVRVNFNTEDESVVFSSEDDLKSRLPIAGLRLSKTYAITNTRNLQLYDVFSRLSRVNVTFHASFDIFEARLDFNFTPAQFPNIQPPYLVSEDSTMTAFRDYVLRVVETIFTEKSIRVFGKEHIGNLECDFNIENSDGKIFLVGEAKIYYYLTDYKLPETGVLPTADEIKLELKKGVVIQQASEQRGIDPENVLTGSMKQQPGELHSQVNLRRGLRQLAAYLYKQKTKVAYGIFTTYCHSYFVILRRLQNKEVELEVSPVVGFDDEQVLQRIAKFVYLAFNNPIQDITENELVNFSPTKDTGADKRDQESERVARYKKRRERMDDKAEDINQNSQKIRIVEGTSETGGKHACYGDYIVKDLIGRGRSGCVLQLTDNITGRKFAAKIIGELKDKASHEREEIISELLNEEAIYKILNDAQLEVVPKFYCGGYFYNQYTLLMEELDADPIYKRDLANDQKRAIIDALKQIHDLGILHGDIRESNILLDRKKPNCPYIVDFAWSSISYKKEDFEEEMNELKAILKWDSVT